MKHQSNKTCIKQLNQTLLSKTAHSNIMIMVLHDNKNTTKADGMLEVAVHVGLLCVLGWGCVCVGGSPQKKKKKPNFF